MSRTRSLRHTVCVLLIHELRVTYHLTRWSTYSQNCTFNGEPFLQSYVSCSVIKLYVNHAKRIVQRYPENIPSGTAVPAWAYLDVVVRASSCIFAYRLTDRHSSTGRLMLPQRNRRLMKTLPTPSHLQQRRPPLPLPHLQQLAVQQPLKPAVRPPLAPTPTITAVVPHRRPISAP